MEGGKRAVASGVGGTSGAAAAVGAGTGATAIGAVEEGRRAVSKVPSEMTTPLTEAGVRGAGVEYPLLPVLAVWPIDVVKLMPAAPPPVTDIGVG